MPIFGWDIETLKSVPLSGYRCPHCESKETQLNFTVHYLHVLWVPFVPYDKAVNIQCPNCGAMLRERLFNEHQKTIATQLKESIKVPVKMYTGISIAFISIFVLLFSLAAEHETNQNYLNAPQNEDVYLIRNNLNDNYYFMKLEFLAGDSLYMRYNVYSYDLPVGKMNQHDGFQTKLHVFHKSFINQLDQSGDLKRIFRDYPESSGFDRINFYH